MFMVEQEFHVSASWSYFNLGNIVEMGWIYNGLSVASMAEQNSCKIRNITTGWYDECEIFIWAL